MSWSVLSSKAEAAARHARHIPEALRLILRVDGRWTAAWGVLTLAEGLLPTASLFFVRSLVDALTAKALRPALVAAGLLAGAALVSEALHAAGGWIRANLTELVQDHVAELVCAKSVEVDLGFYDSPEFFDRLHRARLEATYRPAALFQAFGTVVQNVITLAAMLAVLAAFGWWVPVLLFIGTGPAFAVAIRYALRQHALRLRTTADERRSWYYESLMTERDSAAELRLFSLGARFRAVHRELRARLRRERVALTRKNALDEVAAGTIALATAASGLLWVFWRVLQGAVTLGAGAMFYQALNNGFRLSRTLLQNIGQLYSNSLFLGNLFEFLSLKPQITSPAKCVPAPRQLTKGIRFEAVTFRYPGSETSALADFTLEIPPGRMVAFVGPNGAGKSTFIKLLCRFYDPASGRITIDGADLRQFDLEDLRGRITVLFQEPVRYNASAAENISLGGMASVLSRERVEQAAAEAGAADLIARLPHSYDNLLGKQFLEGAELSSGEWQRIALARAFYREAPILILDEPTSAMDPWAEADWLNRFRTLARGRTSILITHRFTTAIHADIIHVMHEGRVLESGSHEQLVTLGGLYARSWRDQVNGRSHLDPHPCPPELSPA